MNKRPVILFLALLMLLPAASMAADVNLHAARKTTEPYQTSPGPVGTCTIYIQGRYAECEFTTEVLVRGRPPCGFFHSVADCRYGYPY